jgi:NAD(P)-dependent dehydrogenase (short-subunit alcohol dehydrogenase family)
VGVPPAGRVRLIHPTPELSHWPAGAAGEIRVRQGDVSQRDECRAVVDACVEEFGKLDVLANVAGALAD